MIQSDKTLQLKRFGTLLGFSVNSTISSNSVDINQGLKCIGYNQKILTLPIVSDQNLIGSVTHYKDLESYVPINKGCYNNKPVGNVILNCILCKLNGKRQS